MIQAVLIIKYNSTVSIIGHLQYNELSHIQPFFMLSVTITTCSEYNIAYYIACLCGMKQYRIYLNHGYSFIQSQLEIQPYNCRTIYPNLEINWRSFIVGKIYLCECLQTAITQKNVYLFPRSGGCDLRLSQPISETMSGISQHSEDWRKFTLIFYQYNNFHCKDRANWIRNWPAEIGHKFKAKVDYTNLGRNTR